MSATILIAVSMLCWAAIEPIGPLAGVSVYQLVWTRYGVHLLFMLAVFGPRHRLKLVQSPRPFRQIVRSLLMLGMPLCFISSAQRIGVSDSLAVFWIAPVLVIAITALTGRSIGGLQTVAATIVGFMGAFLICHPDGGVFRRASALALGMTLCFTLYLVLSRAMKDEFILTKLFQTALWVFISLSLVLPLYWRAPSLRGVAVMAAIGLLGWCGLAALDRAIELAPPARLAPFLYTQPAWTALLAGLLTRQLPSARTLAGLLLVSVGVAVALLTNRQPKDASLLLVNP